MSTIPPRSSSDSAPIEQGSYYSTDAEVDDPNAAATLLTEQATVIQQPVEPDDQSAEASARRVRTLANRDGVAANREVERALKRHPLAAELRYLHAVLLLDAGRADEAARALRQVLYLDRTLAAVHFMLGAVLRQAGDVSGARRAYRNAYDLCSARPADEAVPLADGASAARLAEAARVELAMLDHDS